MSSKTKALPLGDIATFKSGGTPNKSRADYWGGEYPWVSAKDLKFPVITDSIDRLTQLGFEAANIASENSLLILVRGMTLFKDVPVCLAGRDVAFNQDIKALVVSKELNPLYLMFYLLSQKNRLLELVDSAGHGTGRLDTDLLKSFPVVAPSLPKQAAIVSLLSTWDLAIEKTERLIAAKERSYLWLSTKYLFGDTADIANASKKTKWFAVPDHWNIVKIGEIAKEVSSFNNSGDNIPVLSCTKYDGLVDSLAYFDKQVFSLDTSTYKVVSRGQFAYATNHIEEGSIGYQDVYDKGLVSPMYTVFKTDKNVDDGYLYKVFKSVVYLHIFRANTSSSVDRRGSLRWKEFAKLPIPLPPIEEQKQIAAILNTTHQEIDLLKKQAEALRRQKRGLMQKLLSGEWRVNIDGEQQK